MIAALGLMAGLAAGAVQSPVAPCGGAVPHAGALLHGPALHVIDGDTLCVAQGPEPSTWVAVRLADVPDTTAWGTLMAAAFALTLDCQVIARGVARCTIDGRPLGQIVRQPAVRAAGQAWRAHPDPERPTVVCLNEAAHRRG